MSRDAGPHARGFYARGFYDLQVDFAAAVAARTGRPLAGALLDYTNLFVRFGLGRSFDPAHPGWRAYVAGLATAADPREWTYAYARRRPPAPPPPGLVATVGCFSYARLDRERIRLHFHNAGPPGRSPLAAAHRHRRRAELRGLFRHVAATVGGPVRVLGASWLYNLEAYRRLFPPAYLASARPAPGRFRHMPLWGQFLDRAGGLREPAAARFRERLAAGLDPARLDDCFPLPVLALEAPAGLFLEHYGLRAMPPGGAVATEGPWLASRA
jgi:hypothetical protein